MYHEAVAGIHNTRATHGMWWDVICDRRRLLFEYFLYERLSILNELILTETHLWHTRGG